MNRVEFMHQLERILCDIPENDRLDAIAYYEAYFDEAGEENEAQVIRELGSPGRVAAMIKADIGAEEECRENMLKPSGQKKGLPIVLIIVLLVFASPILIGVGGGLFGGLLGVLFSIVGIIFAVAVCAIIFVVAGIGCLIWGIIRVMLAPLEGLALIGVGGILSALGLLLGLLFVWCAFKWLPALFRWFINWVQKLFHRGERRGNE